MRAFLTSCLAIIIIVIGSLLILNVAQRTATAAYSGDGARVDPRWSVRRVMKREVPTSAQGIQTGSMVGGGVSGECEAASAFAWLAVDFGSGDDNPGCK